MALPQPEEAASKYAEPLKLAYNRAVQALREGFSSSGGWDFHSKQRDVLIYRKKFLRQGGRGVMACKGVGLVPAPAASVIEVMSNLQFRPFWDELYDRGYTVEEVDAHTSVSYVAYRAPWPVRPRDMVVIGRSCAFSNGALLVYSTSVSHPDSPPSKGYVRQALHFCAVYVEPLDAATSKVTYIVSSDPRGSIPKLMVNTVLTKTPLSIAAVRQLVVDRPEVLDHVKGGVYAELVRLAVEENRVAPGQEDEDEAEDDGDGDEYDGDEDAAASAKAPAGDGEEEGGEEKDGASTSGADAAATDGGLDLSKFTCDEFRLLAQFKPPPCRYDEELADGHARAVEAVHPDSPGWVFHSRLEEVDIYTKPPSGDSPFNGTKGVGELPFPAEVVKWAFLELDLKPRWDEMYDHGRPVEALDAVTGVSYTCLKGTWPVAPRDLVAVGRAVPTEGGGVLIFSRSIERPDVPPVKGCQRAELFFGATLIVPLGPNRCRVVYSVGFDPKGSIPKMIINAANVKGPLAVAKIRKLLESDPSVARRAAEESKRVAAKFRDMMGMAKEKGGAGADVDDDDDDDKEEEEDGGGGDDDDDDDGKAALDALAADPGLAAWEAHPLSAHLLRSAPVGYLVMRVRELRGAGRMTFGLRQVVDAPLRLFCRVSRGADLLGETRRRKQRGDEDELAWPSRGPGTVSVPVRGSLGGEPVRVALLARCNGEEDVLMAEVLLPLERLAASGSTPRRLWLPLSGPRKEDAQDPPLLGCDAVLRFSRLADLLSAGGEPEDRPRGGGGGGADTTALTADDAAASAPGDTETGRFVDAALELAEEAEPVYAAASAVGDLLAWRSPAVSGAYLLAAVALVTFAPELLLPAFAAGLLAALGFFSARGRLGRDPGQEAAALRGGLAAPLRERRAALSFRRREEALEARRAAVREVGADMERAARALRRARRAATVVLAVLLVWGAVAAAVGAREAATAAVALAGCWGAPPLKRVRSAAATAAAYTRRVRARVPL